MTRTAVEAEALDACTDFRLRAFFLPAGVLGGRDRDFPVARLRGMFLLLLVFSWRPVKKTVQRFLTVRDSTIVLMLPDS